VGYRNELSGPAVFAGESLAECLVAHVDRVEGERVELALADGRVSGRCAFSCLVVPCAGDIVSVVKDREGRHYVTAILERADPGDVELFSQRPMTIRSAARVRVTATTALELDAGERIRLGSPVLEAVVGRFAAFAKAVCVTSGEALLHSKLARLCSELIDVAAQRIGVSAEHSYRQISGTEQVRCRQFDLRADELANVRAQTVLVKAKDLAKIDAAQIQMG
jgi:uncharacterized protein DUF3540